MNDSYIAGFFDGEGSAMILTIRRVRKDGVLFRFRPVVRIVQSEKAILEEIRNHLGFGYVTKSNKDGTFLYVCNGLDNVENFVNRIMSLAPMKGKMLSLLQELIDFQRERIGNVPYSREDVIAQLKIRDALFELNAQNRKNLVQKYPAERVLREHRFVDLDEWMKNRSKNGVQALNEHAQSRKIERIVISCACGCGQKIITPDNKGRNRRYVWGHNNRKTTEVIST